MNIKNEIQANTHHNFLSRYRTELLLAVLALALYLPGSNWGMPYANDPLRARGWATDAITPLDSLAQLHDLVHPKPSQFPAYPLMHHFVLAIVYSPYLLFLLATKQMSNPTPTYPFGLSDPVGTLRVLEILGKSISLMMALGTVVVIYRAAKILWGHTAGLLASIFIMLLYPMFYYSRTGNVDVPVLFWISLGLLTFTQIIQHGFTTRRAVWIGIFADGSHYKKNRLHAHQDQDSALPACQVSTAFPISTPHSGHTACSAPFRS